MPGTRSERTSETVGRWRKLCIVPGRLEGKLAVVTGANSGIGAATTAELARRGCTVIMACRNMERANSGKERIVAKFGLGNPACLKTDVADESVVQYLTPVRPEQLIVERLNLESLESVKSFAERIINTYPRLNYLVNNAGIISSTYETTPYGFEKTIAVNHLGPFLLTEMLLPVLKLGAPSRIVNVSSSLHCWGSLHKPELNLSKEHYEAFRAYNESKLANIMHAREMAKRLEGSGVIAVSVHPGIVKTEIQRDLTSMKFKAVTTLTRPFAIDAWEGAQTTLYALLSNTVESGAYYDNCAKKTPHHNALNDEDCKWLWDKSLELVELSTP